VVLEGSSEEEAIRGIFYDVGMNLEGDIADLHGQVFCTSERPICRAVCSFHLEAQSRVDVRCNFIGQILSDGDNL
jgi:hypothetical protein